MNAMKFPTPPLVNIVLPERAVESVSVNGILNTIEMCLKA
jgi:hypothetical protein